MYFALTPSNKPFVKKRNPLLRIFLFVNFCVRGRKYSVCTWKSCKNYKFSLKIAESLPNCRQNDIAICAKMEYNFCEKNKRR